MSDMSDALLASLGDGSARLRVLQGTFVSAATTGCLVDVAAGSRIPATLGTSFLPEVNEIVWLWNIGERYFIMGPAAIKPDQGTVVSVASGLVTLTSSLGTTVVAPYVGSAPTAGQTMKLLWHNGPIAMLMSTSPPGNTPPPAPAATTSTHIDFFNPFDAGSYGSGRWWTNQVWASDNNLGAWFYGSQINDTIPPSAVIQSVQIYVSPQTISGSAPNFGVHQYYTNPGISPSYASVTAVSVSPGWVTLPTGFGNSLKNGGGYVGVGVAHGGYNIFNSLAADGQSGKLCIVSTY